jgi:sortase A
VTIVYRVLGVLGRTMITVGVILLLFVTYQLWGTGLHTRAAQAAIEDELVADVTDAAGSDGAPAAEAPSGSPVTFGDGKGLGEALGLTPEEIAAYPTPEMGDPVGYISIPAIGSNWWYVQGDDLSWLRDGPGHFPTTSWPGQTGNAALAGHRTTYGAPFHRIDELEPGDEILIETLQGEFRYEIVPIGELDDMPIADTSDPGSAHFIVNPNDTWILDDYGDDRLTLMACHPKYSAAQRIIVVAQLTDPVAPTTPPTEGDTPRRAPVRAGRPPVEQRARGPAARPALGPGGRVGVAAGLAGGPGVAAGQVAGVPDRHPRLPPGALPVLHLRGAPAARRVLTGI